VWWSVVLVTGAIAASVGYRRSFRRAGDKVAVTTVPARSTTSSPWLRRDRHRLGRPCGRGRRSRPGTIEVLVANAGSRRQAVAADGQASFGKVLDTNLVAPSAWCAAPAPDAAARKAGHPDLVVVAFSAPPDRSTTPRQKRAGGFGRSLARRSAGATSPSTWSRRASSRRHDGGADRDQARRVLAGAAQAFRPPRDVAALVRWLALTRPATSPAPSCPSTAGWGWGIDAGAVTTPRLPSPPACCPTGPVPFRGRVDRARAGPLGRGVCASREEPSSRPLSGRPRSRSVMVERWPSWVASPCSVTPFTGTFPVRWHRQARFRRQSCRRHPGNRGRARPARRHGGQGPRHGQRRGRLAATASLLFVMVRP